MEARLDHLLTREKDKSVNFFFEDRTLLPEAGHINSVPQYFNKVPSARKQLHLNHVMLERTNCREE